MHAIIGNTTKTNVKLLTDRGVATGQTGVDVQLSTQLC